MANDYERSHGEGMKRRGGMRKREAERENTPDRRRARIVSRSSVGDAFLSPFAERGITEKVAVPGETRHFSSAAIFFARTRSRWIFNSKGTQCRGARHNAAVLSSWQSMDQLFL